MDAFTELHELSGMPIPPEQVVYPTPKLQPTHASICLQFVDDPDDFEGAAGASRTVRPRSESTSRSDGSRAP